ncbi:hypothetical protein OG788_26330 [Streptomyces sp. NBC_00647]|uniref:hypothetical protein n=1 Tax=Streptomyces sp. NBC_00647 TaxID=2975796 RepID=UPI003252E936
MHDINCCQICGKPAPPVDGWCGEVIGYRLVPDPWAASPSFLDGNLHFSCLEESDKREAFHGEFLRFVQAGHEEVDSLDGTLPPLTRMGLGMSPVFSGDACDIFQSRVSDRWMVVKKCGPWLGLGLPQLRAISEGAPPVSPSDVTRYRLPVDLGDQVGAYGLADLLGALGVRHRYADAADPARVEYRFVDYYAPKRLLDYIAVARLPLPDEARAFLAAHARTYTPVTFDDEGA